MKRCILLFKMVLFLFLFDITTYSQSIQLIKGFVYNAETNNPVPNAHLVISGKQTGTSSGINGYFELPLETGQHTIRVTSIGFSDREILINVKEASQESLRIELLPKNLEIQGVDVFGKYFLPHRDTSINRIPVSILPSMTSISAIEIEKQGAVTDRKSVV